MKKIKEIIMKDIGWKLLSVAIAVGLWFMVINIENPIENRNYTTKITFENEEVLAEQGLVITNLDEIKDTNVTIKVRGERMALDRLSQYKSYIQATVDLKKATASDGNGEYVSLYLEVKLPSTAGDTFEIMSKDPAFVPVKVENIVSVEKSVEPVINGQAKDGYVTEKATVSPQTVKISGAESAVNMVSVVEAAVTIENPNKDVSIKATPVAYDKDGNVVSGITFNHNQVTVNIGVNKSKRVPVNTTVQGVPAVGYTVEGIEWQPKYIDIVGDEEKLSDISSITLPVINVSGSSANVEKTYDIKDVLPEGIYIYEGAQSDVKVTVYIGEEVTKELIIDSSKITMEGNLQNGLQASFVPENVHITVKGSQKAINSIDESAIKGTVNIENLTEGTHNVEVTFNLPDGVSISGGAYTAEVLVSGNTSDENVNTSDTSQTETEQ